jgi:hypothetical protein
MRIRFARWVAMSMLTSGAAIVVVGLVAFGDVSEALLIFLIFGLGLAGFGVLYLGPIPYVIVTETAVRVPIVMGGAGHLDVGPRDRLLIRDNRITVSRPGSQRDTAPAYRAMAHRGDWDALVRELAAHNRRRATER